MYITSNQNSITFYYVDCDWLSPQNTQQNLFQTNINNFTVLEITFFLNKAF